MSGPASHVRVGQVVILDGRPVSVTSTSTLVKLTGVDLISGASVQQSIPPNSMIEETSIEKITYKFIKEINGKAVLLNMNTFAKRTISMPRDPGVLGQFNRICSKGGKSTILFDVDCWSDETKVTNIYEASPSYAMQIWHDVNVDELDKDEAARKPGAPSSSK